MFWGVILLLVAIGILLIVSRADRHAPTTETHTLAPASRTVRPLEPLALEGLSIPEQIVVLHSSAIKLGQRLVAEFPQSPDAQVSLGNVYRQIGQSAQAVDCWNGALALDSRRADVYTFLAILAEEKGDAEQALDHWKKVLSLKPALPGLRDSLANTLMTLNRWDQAIEVLHEERKISPHSARNRYLLGRAYAQQNNFSKAASHFEETIALDPNWAQAYYELSTALLRCGQREEARHFRNVFTEKKKHTREDGAYGYTAQDDLFKAKQTLIGVCAGAATLFQNMNQGTLALALLQRIASLDPNDLAGQKRLAARYQALGRLPEALNQCEQIARLTPGDPTCQMLIGSLSLGLGRTVRAQAAYRQMITLAPNVSTGYVELAKISLRTGKDLAQARSLAERAVQLNPSAGHYYVLGLIHLRTGDKGAAVKALQQALQRDPANPTYQRTYDQLSSGQ